MLNPSCIATTVQFSAGSDLVFRPLASGDAALLGDYFVSLTDATRRFYGPHPFDQATADHLCATINHAEAIRFVAVGTFDGRDTVAAYFILVLSTGEGEHERYAKAGIELNPKTDCTFAPSVRDVFQNQGLGSPLFEHVIDIARRLGRRKMVLMGGVQVLNVRAVHFYEKQGFQKIGGFEGPPGIFSQDMVLELS
jgi:GNAT superfamily N-acetyltransferase